MAILKKIIPLIFPLFLTGCFEDFTPDIDVKPVLCINSLISAGEPISVAVTHTWLYTDENAINDNKVKDASVFIYANGESVSSDYIPREGDHIRIYAESPTYGVAEGEVTVPVAVPFESLEWEPVITDLTNDNSSNFSMMANLTFNLITKLTIKDPANVVNYYHFSYIGYYPNTDAPYEDDYLTYYPYVSFTLGSMIYDTEPIFGEHIGIFDRVTGTDAYGFTSFTDRQFSGKSYTLNIQLEKMNYYVQDKYEYDEALLDCGLVFTLSTVSASYYDWANYHWQIYGGIIGDLADVGLSDPVWGYSNVSTGAGVIAAMSHVSYTLSLKDFLKATIPPLSED